MTATGNAGENLFDILARNCEQSEEDGIVQIFSDDPPHAFFITIQKSGLSYSGGVAPRPSSTIWMKDKLLSDIVGQAHRYDARDPRYAMRMAITGSSELAHFILELVKTPTPATVAMLEKAKQIAKERPVAALERVRNPDKYSLAAAMFESRPVVISGLIDGWNVGHWTPETLVRSFGSMQISPVLPIPVRDFVVSMMSPEGVRPGTSPKYTGGVALPPTLLQHFPLPPVLDGMIDSAQFWLGVPDRVGRPVTGLHCDCRHGFLCQIFGRKRVILYSPDQEPLVYARRAFNTYRPCWTGPDKPDYELYPLFKQAQPLDVVVGPGEVLFLPLGWFHCVFALEPVMSVSLAVMDAAAERLCDAYASAGVGRA